LLNTLLDEHNDELTGGEMEAFASMRYDMTAYNQEELTSAQRVWVKLVYDRIVPEYANLVSSGAVPRGREVPTPDVLLNLPKKPPRRL
jgi:hypothetical protein